MTITAGAALGLARDTLGFFHRVLFPVLLLAVRIWLAKIFFEHGMETVMNSPERAFGTDPMVTVQIAAAILLAAGLMTRIAAIPIAILSLFVYFGTYNVSGHILCALLAFGLTVFGAGPISLDRIVGPGLARSALPFAEWPDRFYRAFENAVTPVFLLVLRIWMAGLFWMTGEPLINGGDRWVDYGSGVAPAVVASFMTDPVLMAVQLVLGVLLAVGLGGRFAALVLGLLTIGVMLGEQSRPENLLWALVLGYLLLAGPGRFSIDALIDRWLRGTFPEYSGMPAFSLEGCPRVVIVGAGFGGLAAARVLAKARANVTVIDRHNYHLFQPLLYQVATAGLSPADIAMPIRGVLRDQFNTRVIFGKVTGIDSQSKAVFVGDTRVSYDYLILATGARHAYFGRDEWEPLAPGLKKIDDATHVRQRILLAFERAETAADETERQRLMTFVVVGGGPTGVELAGAIAELAKDGMANDFRVIDPSAARVILVQSAPRILPMFPNALSDRALRSLTEIGVDVRVASRVTEIDEQGVGIGDERVPAGTVLWAAGVRASRAAKWLDVEADRAGRVIVEPDLSVPGHRDVFVIGDTASMMTETGDPVPGLAPAAKQSGIHAAKTIAARISGKVEPGRFRYRHLGSLATIGREAAIADFGRLRLSGRPAWWLWGLVHVLFLVGGRNRLSVVVNWAWSYVSYNSSTRLITGSVDEPEETVAAPAAAE